MYKLDVFVTRETILASCPSCGVVMEFRPYDTMASLYKWLHEHVIAAGHEEPTAPHVSGQSGQPVREAGSGAPQQSLPGQGNLFDFICHSLGKSIKHCPFSSNLFCTADADCSECPVSQG